MLGSALRHVGRQARGVQSARGLQSFYQAEVTSIGGRNSGTIKSADDVLDLKTSLPTGLGGKGDTGAHMGTNPEQLFAAGYSSCFLSAMIAAADKEGHKLPKDASVTGIVDIGKAEKGEGFALSVELKVKIPGFEEKDIKHVTEEAHKLCPYSNATRGNMDIKITPVM